MGFSRREYWNGLPCPSAGDLPNQGIEPRSPTLQEDSLPPHHCEKGPALSRSLWIWRHHKSYLETELQPFYQVIGEIASFE